MMDQAHVIKDWWEGDKPMRVHIRIVFDTAEIGRQVKWFFQRLFRGWSDDQIWGLGDMVCRFVLPRLKAFNKSKRHGYPADLKNQKQWTGYLKEMEWALATLKEDDSSLWGNKKARARLDRGLALCGKYLFTLWD